MKIVKIAILLFYFIVKSSGKPVPLHTKSQDLFVTENFRVRRQVGYVYDKPSVSFDLPTQAPTLSTQAPNVDRTQAQMMYYAYPAPAAGSNAINTGASSGAKATANTSAGTAPGSYSYPTPNTASARAQSASATGSSTQSSRGSPGYGYNTPSIGTGPVSTGSVQSSNAGSSGYAFGSKAPVGTTIPSKLYQPANGADSVQTIDTSSLQTAVSSGSGYAYTAPMSAVPDPGVVPTVDVSTNAPKYLPPKSVSGNSNSISSISKGSPTSGAVSNGPAEVQPLDQYLPPVNQLNPSASPPDQYLPPNSQPNPPPSLLSSGPFVNVREQTGPGSGPSSNYIQPNGSPSPIPANNTAPRSFSLAVPPTEYLPPNVNSQISDRNSLSTPAPTYLPPILI